MLMLGAPVGAASTRSTARSRTEAARGLVAISSGSARSAPRVTSRKAGWCSSGTTGRSGGASDRVTRGERLLDQPVLERVVGLHDHAAADPDRVDGGRDRAAQHRELVVDLHPQRLEGALGGVAAGAARRGRDLGVQQLDQARGGRERCRSRAAGPRRRRSCARTAPRRTPGAPGPARRRSRC